MNTTPQPRWNNIVAAILALGAVIFLLTHHRQAAGFLETATRIGPGHSSEDKTLGLIAIGICGVTVVAIVRLLTSNRRD